MKTNDFWFSIGWLQKKKDIAADHLAFLLGRFPDDPDLDIFAYSEGRKKAVLEFVKSNYQNYQNFKVKIIIFYLNMRVDSKNNEFYKQKTLF